VGLSRFELESLAPKAKRIDQATPRAQYFFSNIIQYLKTFMKEQWFTLFMDFNIKNPLHILAFILLMATFLIIVVMPILTFIGIFPSTQSVENQQISESLRALSEAIFLILQLVLVFGLLVIIPILWYVIINKCNLKEVFLRLKLKLENIDLAFLWGIFAAVIIFVIIFAVELILIRLGQNPQDLSNIPDLQKLFSWPAMFFLVAIQPIAEEIFFRGFLFEKIENFAGGAIAIFITAFLFGLAHMSYGKIFPVVMPILMGLILGFIVYKTKNLFSSIIAHIVFNITVLTLAYVGYELSKDLSLIL